MAGSTTSASSSLRTKSCASRHTLHLTLRVAPGHILALVPKFLSAGQADLDLDVVAYQVHAQRHDRQSLCTHLGVEILDLSLVEQQLATAVRLRVVPVALLVGCDVHLQQPRLTVLDAHVAVPQLRATRAQRLHLRAGQLDAGFDLLQDAELKRGTAIAREERVRWRLARGHDWGRSLRCNRRPRRNAAAVIARAPGGTTCSTRYEPSRAAATPASPGTLTPLP